MPSKDANQGNSMRGLRAAAAVVTAIACVAAASTTPVHAQLKRKMMLVAICGTAGWGGYKIGDKLADMAIAKSKLMGAEADKMRLSFRIGVAAAACGTSTWLANTVYNNLSKRDREARKREMEAALADAQPGSRQYVLPESGLSGKLETLAAEQDGDKECRVQLDTLGNGNEPASARWCRKSPTDKFEVDLGV